MNGAGGLVTWEPLGPGDSVMVALGGVLGGFFNTAAVGGGLLSFLALGFAGVPALSANITNLVVMPASFLSGLRRFTAVPGDWAAIVGALAGTVTGALLVALVVDPAWFRAAAPWLLLVAALLLAVYPELETRWPRTRPRHPLIVAAVMVLPGIYAGGFGGAVGTLVLVALALATGWPLGRANEAKVRVCLATAVIGSAAYLAAGAATPGAPIHGWAALVLTPAMALGGELGARARRAGWIHEELMARMAILGTAAGAVYLLNS